MATIVGIKDLRQTVSKKTGQMLDAYMVFYTAPVTGVVGEEASSVFVTSSLFIQAAQAAGKLAPADMIGRHCEFSFNRRGFLEHFALIE